MRRLLGQIKVSEQVVGYRHIRDRVRELILTGQISPDNKLPSTQALASQWNVDPGTVHSALASLVKEGLLLRKPRKGTFVRRREEKLTCVGLYYHANIWAANSSLYLQALHEALCRELEQLGIRVSLCIDSRPHEHQREPWSELAEMAGRRQVHAVIAPTAGWGRARWLSKLPVPSVMFTNDRVPHRVTNDVRQGMELALRDIVRQGCRTVGLIHPGNSSAARTFPDVQPVSIQYMEAFTDGCSQLGLEFKNAWIRTANTDESCQPWDERFGYEQFHGLWKLPTRPEGLVVFPDTAVRGVITALLEARVRIPQDLKLVFYKNAEVQLLCPLPATFISLSLTECATAAIQMIQKQYAGRPCGPVVVPLTLQRPDEEGLKGK